MFLLLPSKSPTVQFNCANATLTLELSMNTPCRWRRLLHARSSAICRQSAQQNGHALVATSGRANPFVRYEFSACAAYQRLRRCAFGVGDAIFDSVSWREPSAPSRFIAKQPSYGEYVFDWAWANAYQQHGVEYYPKWLAAVPFTPLPGVRLLARDPQTRAALARALITHTRESGLSSLHVLFAPLDEIEPLAASGMLTRRAVQFHWFNRDYASFSDYLASLAQPSARRFAPSSAKSRARGSHSIAKSVTKSSRRLGFVHALLLHDL